MKATAHGAEIDLNTLPFVLSADLARLNQTLESFAHTRCEVRGACEGQTGHLNSPRSDSTKTNIRIGGALVDVRYMAYGFLLRTSAIKMVGRERLIAVQIDTAKLAGPNLGITDIEPAISLSLQNLSMKYLFAPEEHDLSRMIALLTPSNDKFEG
ncbi:hypothetical protein MRB53_041405 [Persea americana]|nr:hypothetical protein MRB53_041405 [Persea americana]